MMALINKLRTELGLTVLLIEHDMKVVMGISDRVTVLDHGERIAEGTPEEVREEPQGHRGLPRGPGVMTRRAAEPTDAAPAPPAAPAGEPLLKLDNVHTYYGQIHALKGVSIEVNQGEVVTLIGANGAGKTTTLKTVCGLLHPRQGTVTFDGKDVSKTAAHDLVKGGHRPRPGGSPDLLPADRPREPPDGRLHAAGRRRSTQDVERVITCSRACGSGPTSRAARCPAASSRCSRSGGR